MRNWKKLSLEKAEMEETVAGQRPKMEETVTGETKNGRNYHWRERKWKKFATAQTGLSQTDTEFNKQYFRLLRYRRFLSDTKIVLAKTQGMLFMDQKHVRKKINQLRYTYQNYENCVCEEFKDTPQSLIYSYLPLNAEADGSGSICPEFLKFKQIFEMAIHPPKKKTQKYSEIPFKCTLSLSYARFSV